MNELYKTHEAIQWVLTWIELNLFPFCKIFFKNFLLE